MKASWQGLPMILSSSSSRPSHTPNIDSPKHNRILSSHHHHPPSSSFLPSLPLLARAPVAAASLLLCCLLLLFSLQALPPLFQPELTTLYSSNSPLPSTYTHTLQPHCHLPSQPRPHCCPLGGAFIPFSLLHPPLGWSPGLLLAHSLTVFLSQLSLSSSRPAL